MYSGFRDSPSTDEANEDRPCIGVWSLFVSRHIDSCCVGNADDTVLYNNVYLDEIENSVLTIR